MKRKVYVIVAFEADDETNDVVDLGIDVANDIVANAAARIKEHYGVDIVLDEVSTKE